MPRICLSYRRADSVDITGRIYDQLVTRYGAGDVFMDVSGIPYGADYRDHIQDVFRGSKILLAVIGRNWLGDATGGAAKRIQESADPVHVEILRALGLKIHLVPVLLSFNNIQVGASVQRGGALAVMAATVLDENLGDLRMAQRLAAGVRQ